MLTATMPVANVVKENYIVQGDSMRMSKTWWTVQGLDSSELELLTEGHLEKEKVTFNL